MNLINISWWIFEYSLNLLFTWTLATSFKWGKIILGSSAIQNAIVVLNYTICSYTTSNDCLFDWHISLILFKYTNSP